MNIAFWIVFEYQIVENQSNILSMKLANMIFTRDNGKYCGTDIIKYEIG